jgi:lipopolysaccharide transport protein LptA
MSHFVLKTFLSVSIATLLSISAFAEYFSEDTPTTITSDALRIETTDNTQVFYFEGAVRMNSETLNATSNHLEVFSQKDAKDATPGQFGSVDWIKATGNVRIEQIINPNEPARIATAGVAEIFPAEAKIILSGTPRPVVTDDKKGKVEGERITLFKDKGQMLVEGNADQTERPKVTLTGVSFKELLGSDDAVEETKTLQSMPGVRQNISEPLTETKSEAVDVPSKEDFSKEHPDVITPLPVQED